jgi:MFS transporter, DHA2 family, methylenomycin A resistance protein
MGGSMTAPPRLGWTTAAASFGFALVQLDVTVVNVALPAMSEALKSSITGLQWVVDAYALAFAALLLTAGFLGDRFGARKIYLAGLALFAIASLGCGLAPAAPVLIAARCIQGLAAAAMLPCSLTLINHAAPDPSQGANAVGWWTAAGSIAIALGPIAGGLLLGIASWRSIFLVNLPVCAVGALLTWRVPETKRKSDEDHRELDLSGQVLAAIALAAITGAVIEAKPLGFGLPLMGLAVTGLAATLLFARNEARSRTPMLPLGLFSDRKFSTAIVFGIVVNLTLYGAIFVFSLYLQRVLNYSAVTTGLAYLPLTATLFFANILSGRSVAQAGPRMPMTVGATIDAVGFLALLLAGERSSYWLLLPAFVLIPAGMGFGVPAMTTVVLSSVEKSKSGIASAVLNAARQAGGAIGVALFGALAGEGREHVVAALHRSGLIAAALLVSAAILAALMITKSRPPL